MKKSSEHPRTGFDRLAKAVRDRERSEAELARLRNSAIESARSKSSFVANVSHEIRTPLNGIKGMVGLLLAGDLLPEQREQAATIRASADTLLTLVNGLLDLAKIEAGKMTIQPVEFELEDLVDSVTQVLAEAVAAKRMLLHTVIPTSVPGLLRGDGFRLRQVLLNLIGNAVKFTHNGSITIAVAVESETETHASLRFSIDDTGIGIADEDKPRLFAPFVQADGGTTRQYGGTGLGLAISRQLVEMMGGRIGLASKLNEGSSFWFTLPLEKQPPGAEALKPQPNLAGFRALIVDPNATNRSIAERQLSSFFVDVTSVEKGIRALTALQNAAAIGQPFDVAVFEMSMPEMDGLALARAIRADPSVAGTPLVLVTAYGRRKSDVDSFHAAGIDAFLLKPVNRSQLGACVALVTAESRKQPTASPEVPDQRKLAPNSVADEPQLLPASSSGPRILVVDDNTVNQKVAVGQLRLLGFNADVADSGDDALAAFRLCPYEVILMDCKMPGMDGYQAAAEIRRIESGISRARIIALTAQALPGEKERCVAAGMDDCITKPLDQEDLIRVMDRRAPAVDPVADESTGSVDEESQPTLDPDRLRNLWSVAETDPSFMSDLLATFVTDAADRLHELSSSIEQGDADALALAAHALLSSASNIGAVRLSRLCAETESRARGSLLVGATELSRIKEEFHRAADAFLAEASRDDLDL